MITFEFTPPSGKVASPIKEWTTVTDRQPTAGGTPPSQLFCTWHADQHEAAELARKRAEAAVPKTIPTLSGDANKGEFDDWL